MQRAEIPNNTPEQVREYVQQALALVDDLEPPKDLREAVFTAACGLFGSKQILMQQPQPVTLPDLGRINSDLSRRRH
jgi:hypothetical protein